MSKVFKIGIGYDQENMCCKCFNHHCHVHDAINSSIVSVTPLSKTAVVNILNKSSNKSTIESGDKNVPVAKGNQIGVL